MPSGRRPKPTALKLIQGNPGKRALPKSEPRSPKGLPAPPKFLTPEGIRAWNTIGQHLEAMGVVAHCDQVALALLADACADWLQARQVLADAGEYYESETQSGTIIRAHPAVMMRENAWRRVRSMLVEFGMTPSARSKAAPIPDDKEADPFEVLLGGRSG